MAASGKDLSLISQLLKRCSGYSHCHHPGRHLQHLLMSARLSVLSSFILDSPILCRSCVHSSQHTASWRDFSDPSSWSPSATKLLWLLLQSLLTPKDSLQRFRCSSTYVPAFWLTHLPFFPGPRHYKCLRTPRGVSWSPLPPSICPDAGSEKQHNVILTLGTWDTVERGWSLLGFQGLKA